MYIACLRNNLFRLRFKFFFVNKNADLALYIISHSLLCVACLLSILIFFKITNSSLVELLIRSSRPCESQILLNLLFLQCQILQQMVCFLSFATYNILFGVLIIQLIIIYSA